MFSNIQTFTTGFTTGFSDMQLRIVDTKNEYIREMQSILSNESNSKTEKLTSSIQQNNELLILRNKTDKEFIEKYIVEKIIIKN